MCGGGYWWHVTTPPNINSVSCVHSNSQQKQVSLHNFILSCSTTFSRRMIFAVLADWPETWKVRATNFSFGRRGYSKTSSICKSCFCEMLQITQSAKIVCLENLALYSSWEIRARYIHLLKVHVIVNSCRELESVVSYNALLSIFYCRSAEVWEGRQ